MSNINEKYESLQLEMAKHLAKEALDKLKAEGVIKSHTMAIYTSGPGGSGYGPSTFDVRYNIRPANRFSGLFHDLYIVLKDNRRKEEYLYGTLTSSSAPTAGGYSSRTPITLTAQSWVDAVSKQQVQQVQIEPQMSKGVWQSLKGGFIDTA